MNCLMAVRHRRQAELRGCPTSTGHFMQASVSGPCAST
jgi:hypothetical protein